VWSALRASDDLATLDHRVQAMRSGFCSLIDRPLGGRKLAGAGGEPITAVVRAGGNVAEQQLPLSPG
jgi:hypothetical protein